MATWVIEVTEFKSVVRCELGGHLEAVMASEAITMVVRSNIHRVTSVTEVADFNSEVNFDLQGH